MLNTETGTDRTQKNGVFKYSGIETHPDTHACTFFDVNVPSVGGGIDSAAHRFCFPDGRVVTLINTREHETQEQHPIGDAATHLQLFNDFKQLRVLR